MNSPETILKEKGFYAAAVHGQSMEPLLYNHRDTVYIEPATQYKRLDVVLFRRADVQLVLHRILRVKNDGFVIGGDAEYVCEHVKPSQILGVMTAFTRGERTVRTSDLGYRLYSRLWTLSFPTKRVLQALGRVCRKRR